MGHDRLCRRIFRYGLRPLPPAFCPSVSAALLSAAVPFRLSGPAAQTLRGRSAYGRPRPDTGTLAGRGQDKQERPQVAVAASAPRPPVVNGETPTPLKSPPPPNTARPPS